MRSSRCAILGIPFRTVWTASLAVSLTLGLALATGTSAAHADQGQNVDSLAVVDAHTLAQTLVGKNIDIVNVRYTGATDAAGLFSGMGGALGIKSGVVLTTGLTDHQRRDNGSIEHRAVLYGPNLDDATGFAHGQPGDDDLNRLVKSGTVDAAALEIDFIPDGDSISFRYVFGSEEYPEFVDSNFNDVFAFFVNGKNYATVNDESGERVVVSINTINRERNSQYYRDNSADAGTPYNTGLDGMTTVLKVKAPVDAGEVNTLKVVIADRGDYGRDSAVMLEAGSFTSVVNHAPVIQSQNFIAATNTAVKVPLLAADPNNDELTYTVFTSQLAGELWGDPAEELVFVPEEGFSGTTSFTYLAHDGELNSNVATVTLQVDDNPHALLGPEHAGDLAPRLAVPVDPDQIPARLLTDETGTTHHADAGRAAGDTRAEGAISAEAAHGTTGPGGGSGGADENTSGDSLEAVHAEAADTAGVTDVADLSELDTTAEAQVLEPVTTDSAQPLAGPNLTDLPGTGQSGFLWLPLVTGVGALLATAALVLALRRRRLG